MEIEKKRAFIINFIYILILISVFFCVLKFGLPMIAPFVAAFIIAYFLNRPIRYLHNRIHINKKLAATFIVLIFYSTVGLLVSLLGVKAIAAAKTSFVNLPYIYASHIEPILLGISAGIQKSFIGMDVELVQTLEEMFLQFTQSLGELISSLSVKVMSVISGIASSLPGLFIEFLLMIISTFFITIDYDKLTLFILNQFSGRTRKIFLQIKQYVGGTLFVCIRSYAMIIGMTFIELTIGLTVIGIEYAVLIALFIAVFDIFPVVGTGGIMIPWAVISALQGNYKVALGLVILYLVITVIRNIVEPKLVGSQIGLHPVVTLISMFVGAQIFGVLGLFGFPIGLSLLRHLNDNGTIKIFKMHTDAEN